MGKAKFDKYNGQVDVLLQTIESPMNVARVILGDDSTELESFRKHISRRKQKRIGKIARSIPDDHDVMLNWNMDDVERDFIPRDRRKEISENKVDGTQTLSYEGTGDGRITSLEDLVEYCGIDLDVWEIERYITNKWEMGSSVDGKVGVTPLFQVKVFLKKKEEEDDVVYLQAVEQVADYLGGRDKLKIDKGSGSGVGLVEVADLHIGAFIRGLKKTEDFDLEKVISQLDIIAEKVNEHKFKRVHLAILGDLIESFTGLNHPNSWKGMVQDGHGANIAILAHEILSDFFRKIRNLKHVYMVSGNHDRVTSNKKEDDRGEFTKMVAYHLDREFSNLDIDYDPLCISVEIDGIHHTFTHGHLGFSKKNIGEVFFKYGKQGMFNILSSGHLHSRKKSEPIVMRDFLLNDSADYRGITVPSIFPGNWYSESSGWTSTPGFIIIKSNNINNKPDVIDYSL